MDLDNISSRSGPVPVFPTVVHMLADSAASAPDALALVFNDARLTYAEYRNAIAHLAQQLIALGARDQRVATVLPNGCNTCIATYAILAAGAQCVPLNPLYTTRELSEIFADARPHVIIYDARFRDAMSPLAAQQAIAHTIVVDDEHASLTRNTAVAALPDPLPRADSLAMLQYTGGTTGRAKGVNLTHYATSINVSQREGLLPTTSSLDTQRIYCVMPLFHAYALAMGLHLACWCRGALIIHERFHPAVAPAHLE